MLVSIIDRMMFGDRQITADGYLATVGKISRSGTQEYLGSELGRPEMNRVTVYRDADEVFDEDAIRSFAYKPVTDDHPPVAVTSKNWRTYSRGQLGGKALRDGEHLEFPMVVMDQDLIDKIQSGKSDLSAGYTAEISFEDGIAPDGTPYQAKMTSIRGNHCAVVAKGRALTACIGDAWPTEDITDSPATAEKWLRKAIALHEKHMNGDVPTTGKAGAASQELMMTQMKNALSELAGEKVKPKMKMGDTTTHTKTLVKEAKHMSTLMLDGLKVDLTDAEAVSAAFAKLADKASKAETALADAQTKAATDATTAATALADANAKVATLEAEKATLSQELADARDPAKLRDAAAEYGKVVEKAKAMGVTVSDADSLATVKRNAVNAKLGDVAKDWTDAQVDVSFATLTVAAPSTTRDTYQDAMANRKVVDFADAAKTARDARDEMIAGFNKRNRADAE